MKENGWTTEKVEDWLVTHNQYNKKQQTPPPEVPTLEPPKPLGEAILGSSEPDFSDFIPKQEVLNMLPDDWIVRAWSIGPQLLVRQIRHKLTSQSTEMTGSKQG
jgi:hypothetical protein